MGITRGPPCNPKVIKIKIPPQYTIIKIHLCCRQMQITQLIKEIITCLRQVLPKNTSLSVDECQLQIPCFNFFFFLSGFSFTNIHDSRDSREGGGYLFNSSLPLPPASQTLRHQPGDYCRELTSAHSWQPDSNRNLWFPSASR